jgi:hypothetical protein
MFWWAIATEVVAIYVARWIADLIDEVRREREEEN